MDRTHEAVDVETSEIVGLIAYSALAAMTRLAKDGDQAPSIGTHIEHARMSARAFEIFGQLEVWAEHRGLDLPTAAGGYSGLFDDLDARTRPTTWWERSVKTYVTVGAFSDMLLQVSELHDLFDDDSGPWDLGQGEWVRANLAPRTEKDPQLAARLSLWARRVAGEALGLVRSTLFTHPELATNDPDTVDAIVAWVTKRHRERMAGIGLKA
ncbi:ferritin-like fold-containing protein [Schaalia naturae]|uniref:Ferritin-like fold-containing protein n=1 Tax=Schaalia naturae TaxID=635203 RepID=A0ABW2SN51_9ACTO